MSPLPLLTYSPWAIYCKMSHPASRVQSVEDPQIVKHATYPRAELYRPWAGPPPNPSLSQHGLFHVSRESGDRQSLPSPLNKEPHCRAHSASRGGARTWETSGVARGRVRGGPNFTFWAARSAAASSSALGGAAPFCFPAAPLVDPASGSSGAAQEWREVSREIPGWRDHWAGKILLKFRSPRSLLGGNPPPRGMGLGRAWPHGPGSGAGRGYNC